VSHSPSIVALVTLLSLDVTRGLVLAGLGQTPIAITAATNATPIVLTTATAHGVPLPQDGIPQPAHFIVAGVLGTTSANNVDTQAHSFTQGQSLAVQAVAITETTLALYNVDADGFLAPLAGDGPYVGGGTITAAFPDLSILMGREHVTEFSGPPRVVMVPVRSSFGPKSVYNRNTGNAPERAAQIAQRSIATENVLFEVHCWGQSDPRDPRFDFDATRAVAHQLIQSAHLISAGSYKITDGAWADQTVGAVQLLKAGHEFVFGLTLATPILDQALPYAPDDVAALPTTMLQLPGASSSSVSCTG